MKGKSTLINLLEYFKEVTRVVDEGMNIVYLDLAKAFDRGPHW